MSSVVCVAAPNQSTYSETFIQAHRERLPATVHYLYGGSFPGYVYPEQRLDSSLSKLQKALSVICANTRIGIWLHLPPQFFRALALRRFLRRHRVQVVLAEYGPTGAAIMGVCAQAGIPLVVHFHGFDASATETLKTYETRYRHLFREAAAVIAVSREMEAQLLRLGAVRETLYYNPYGVDPELFAQANPAANPPTFLAVGRFVDKKAPQLTLLAFKQVLEACPDARLVMIGDGPLWDCCVQLAHVWNMTEHVAFLGVCSHHEIATSMQAARAFVQHSIRPTTGDSEGTPVAVLEAGMSGLPVVSTRHAGISDVVLHEETGLLVRERDVDAMARAMLRLAHDDELVARMGARAREHIRTHYTMEQHIARLWDILAGVIP
jgi:glycosyltransferase involved in cell wall biosynthesis